MESVVQLEKHQRRLALTYELFVDKNNKAVWPSYMRAAARKATEVKATINKCLSKKSDFFN